MYWIEQKQWVHFYCWIICGKTVEGGETCREITVWGGEADGETAGLGKGWSFVGTRVMCWGNDLISVIRGE